MPIRINLLAEQLHEADVRRRDPVKRAIAVAVLIGASVIGWYGWLLTQKVVLGRTLAKNKEAIVAIEADAAEAREALGGVTKLEKRIHSLNSLATNRVLWAEFLNALQEVALADVPVNEMRISQGYSIERPPSKGRLPMPATSTELISVTIKARDYGSSADQLYNKFGEALRANEWIGARLDGEGANKGIAFDSFGAPTPDRDNPDRSFLPFTLKINFKKVERR